MLGRVGAQPFVAQVELRRQVVSDLLLWLLNNPMTTDQQAPRYIPRRLLAPAPMEIALWWDEPTITFDDATTLLLTVRLSGGVRQPETGRILTVSGPARARLRMEVMSDTWRAPYLGLSVVALDLSGLAVTYAGAAVSASDETPTTLDLRRAGSPLWQLVNDDLITPLTQLPLSFAWSALTDWQEQGLRLGAATASAVDAETVALTFASTDAPPDEANDAVRASAAYLDDDGDYALTLSADGMTQLALHLLATGALPQRLPDAAPPQGDPHRAGQTTIEEIALTLRAGVVSMIAHLRHDDGYSSQDASVVLDFTCEIDRQGALVVTPVDAQAAFLTAAQDQRRDARSAAAEDALSVAGHTLAAAFARELPEVFGQRRPTSPAEHPQLPQQAAIPTTSLTRALTPTRVVVGEGVLTFVCALPANDVRFIAQPPEQQPDVAIRMTQRPTPARATQPPGDSVILTLEADIVAPSYAPYDFHWTTDAQPLAMQDEHTATLTIAGSPTRRGGVAFPTRAEVALIDAFGQVAYHAIRLPSATLSAPPTAIFAPVSTVAGVSDLPTLPGLTTLAPDEYAAMDAFDDPARTTEIVPNIPVGAALRLPSSAQAQRRRRSRLLVALIALALVVAALSGYLALTHTPASGVGASGLGRGASFNPTAATATAAQAASGAVAPTSGPQGTPGATTTAAPGATVTPAPGASPTATVPAASTPTPTLAPGASPTPPTVNPSLSVNNTSNSQGCVVALLPPAAFTLTLTNNSANAANWQIAITQVDSSGTTPWASANAPAGSLAPGASVTVTITPTAASCPGVLGSDTYFLTVMASNQDGSGQPETIEVNDIISDV